MAEHDETTFCPDCAGERGGFSSGIEKCQHHKTVDVISTLTKDLATSRRACEESGLAYETLAEEHARFENLAFHYAKEARELEAERDSLRLALETATSRANELEDACAALVRERDDALRTVKALTPAANYCLQYKPLLLKAERQRDEAVRVLRDIATFGWYAKGAKVARAYLATKEKG